MKTLTQTNYTLAREFLNAPDWYVTARTWLIVSCPFEYFPEVKKGCKFCRKLIALRTKYGHDFVSEWLLGYVKIMYQLQINLN